MRLRSAVRSALHDAPASSVVGASAPGSGEDHRSLVLVALSGGADSLALAAALAAEASGCGVRAGAAIIDHGLQPGSAAVAARAAAQAAALGLAPVVVRRVTVGDRRGEVSGGPEAAARAARYAALAAVAVELGAAQVLTAHTRDDQAEQVLLALVRGSGTRSLAGMPAERPLAEGVALLRPLLAERFDVTRAVTERSCAELGLDPWHDPHNTDPAFTRVRVRDRVLPALEEELGPGLAAGLARSADLAREDADALEAIAREAAGAILARDEEPLTFPVALLAEQPAAIRNRMIRLIAAERFASQLSREHTLAVASLVTDWHGQGPIQAPGLDVRRKGRDLVCSARNPR